MAHPVLGELEQALRGGVPLATSENRESAGLLADAEYQCLSRVRRLRFVFNLAYNLHCTYNVVQWPTVVLSRQWRTPARLPFAPAGCLDHEATRSKMRSQWLGSLTPSSR